MDFTQYGIVGLAIAGTVQALKTAFPAKIQGIVTVVVALAVGLLAGFSGLDNLTPLTANLTPVSGMLIGLATVGLMSAIDRLNAKQ